jgi:sugar phosphate permease
MGNEFSPSDPACVSPSDRNTSKKLSRRVAAIAIFALCIDSLAVRSLSLLAPFIRTGLHLDEGQFGFIVGALMAGTLLVVLPVSRLFERADTRWVFPLIVVMVGVAFIGISFQTSFYGLLAALFSLGILRAGIIPLVNRVITEAFARNQRGVIMGIIYASYPLGGFLGAIVLPAMGEYLDWNSGYRLLGFTALLGGLICWKSMPKAKETVLTRNPIRAASSIRSRTFAILAMAYGLYALSLSADVFVTLYLVDVVKISALVAGSFFGLIQLTGVGGRMFWGILADRAFKKNRWWLLAILNWLTVISFILLTRLNPSSTWWMVAGVMVVIGMSVASSWGILSTILGDIVGISSIATATAVIFFITNIADMLGPVLFGSTLELTHSYQKTLCLFMGVAVLTGFTFSWMAWRGRQKQGQDPA